MFNLDNNEDVTRLLNAPQATLENLANMQTMIEQIQGATFSDEEKCYDFLHYIVLFPILVFTSTSR